MSVCPWVLPSLPMQFLLRAKKKICVFTVTRPTLFFSRRPQGRIQDFKLGGAHLKFCFGYFVWKITILRQKILFFPIAEGGAKIFEVFRVKNHDFLRQKIIFFPILGGACAGCTPPWTLTFFNRQLFNTNFC